MGFLANAIARKSASSLELFREIYGKLWSTKSGANVSLETALQVSAVFACARVLGNGVAQVPLKLRQRQAGGVRRVAEEHALHRLLTRKPNARQTSFAFRQMMSWHVEIAGAFFAFKIAPAGRVLELLPLNPLRMKVDEETETSPLKYTYTGRDGQSRPIPADMIWHVRGPEWEPGFGLNVLRAARDAVGLSISIEESQAALHRNGVQSAGTWSVEGKLNDQQHEQLEKWLIREHAAAVNAWKPMIMDRGAKWVPTTMTGVDAQLLETRREQVAEICRFMGVQPIMAGYSDKAATYASAEQMFLSHVVHTLSPRWTMYEAALDTGLLTEKELDAGYYFDFVEEAMIRGSVKDTKDALLGYVNGGLMYPNEARDKLDLPPDSDPASGKLRIPVNTVQDPSKKPDDEVGPPAA